MAVNNQSAPSRIRVGQAAELLGVSVETLRRWDLEGRLLSERSEGGQRLIGIEEVRRLLAERHKGAGDRPIVGQSARNRFRGIVTRVECDAVVTVVEVMSSPHRIVSLLTAQAVDELELKVGDAALLRGESHGRHCRNPVSQGVQYMRTRLVGLFAVAALVVSACSSGATPSPSAVPTAAPSPAATAAAGSSGSNAGSANLTILAAASLKAVLGQVKTTYEAANPGVKLTISTDASSALEVKIEQGAPSDLFLSADTTNPQKLVGKGLTTGPVTKFAGNLLTVIVPTANPANIKTPADLAKSGVKIIAAGDAVPITKYANQLVANLAKQPGYPADFAAKCSANVVSKEDNVSAVVAKVELGEGDAGIVYVTDAKTSTKVGTVKVPDDANVPATYGGVVIKASTNQAASQAFMTWLTGADGQAIFASFGFLPSF